jgi:ATP-binding cassette subfamily B multidrug efflux pump
MEMKVLLKPYKTSMAIALILMLFEVLVEVWHPILLAKLIDDGILAGDLNTVLFWGGVMIAVALVGFVSGITNTFYASYTSHGFSSDLREKLFHRAQFSPLFDLRRFSTSAWSTRLSNDVSQVQAGVFFSLRMFLRAPLVILASLVLAFMMDAKLALLLVIVTPVVLLSLYFAIRVGFRLFGSAQDSLERTNGIVRENLIGMRLIRSLVREGKEQERFEKTNEELSKRTTAALRLSEMTIPSALLIMNLTIVAIIAIASSKIGSNELKIGAALAIVQYAIRIAGSFSYISLIITNLSRAKASWSRLTELMKVDPAEYQKQGSAQLNGLKETSIRFNQVYFQYPDADTTVLHDLNFQVEEGEMVVIIGATGAGKTSLIQLLPRMHEPLSGTIHMDGIDTRFISLERLRKYMAYVPQESVLFSGTIRENLLWGKADASPEELVEAAQIAQIHQTIMSFPEQYETIVEPNGVNLSGGQRQRIAIARALLRQAKLLLLDDSTSALDMATERELLRALRTRQCTTVLISQKMTTAKEADRILLLDHGQLVAQGNHEQLIVQSELYRRIANSQQREGEVSYA